MDKMVEMSYNEMINTLHCKGSQFNRIYTAFVRVLTVSGHFAESQGLTSPTLKKGGRGELDINHGGSEKREDTHHK